MADDLFDVDQEFKRLSDNEHVLYDSDLLNPTDLTATEESIRDLVGEFNAKVSEQFQALCTVEVEQKSNGVVVSTYIAPGALVVEEGDVAASLSQNLKEGEAVQITEPDANGDFEAAFKKDGMVAMSNCGPPKIF